MYNISKECYALKYSTLRSLANPSILSDIKILAMNDIYLFSNERNNSITKYFPNSMHKAIMAELKYNTNMPEMPDKASNWCAEISNDPPADWISAIKKASGLLSKTITNENVVNIDTAHTLVQILPGFVSRTPPSTVEDTYAQQILLPILQSIFHSDERFEIEWANAELTNSGLKTYKPDFTLFSRVINVKCVLLVSEFKPTKRNSVFELDLVKLGRQMRSTFNDLVNDRLQDPIVSGIRSEGSKLTAYYMGMPFPNLYRMTKLGEISLYESVEQFVLLPNIIMKLLQLKNIAIETVDKAESSILSAAKHAHKRLMAFI